ncbi:MAG: hypothetical protein FWH14_07635 [Oscillospiraceae bacterium]|nr:hypothetical protein [Oscillospiraceae bacterium]
MENKDKIQCHFISNTHWDREWRFSAQRTRHMLVYMIDMLLDILEKEPDFKHFHFDSQTMPIQDYLEVFPEKADILKKHISEGRIAVGPWFNLPDEFCVGGEALIRNLLLGHKIGKEFGAVSKTGYSPFGWGQISQMPQLYSGFGINFASFYRGINTYITPKSEFFWEAPDGTKIYASRLGQRPRYNIWYVVQRPAYFNQSNVGNRTMSWKDGGSLFKFVDSKQGSLDYQYARPEFNYYPETIKERAEQAIREQNHDWTTQHRFWSCGHDSSCPDIREARMIQELDNALPGADVFHSTLRDMEQGIIDNFLPDSPVLKGEMRNPYTKGSVSSLFGWILSARTYIKQDNFETEKNITNYAEPLSVFASWLGAPYPRNFIDLSYNYLLQNHGHDSIGTCGRDIVYEDVICRYRQSKEISSCVMERAMMDVAGDIDTSSWDINDMALVVYNPAPFKRDEILTANIEAPLEWNADSIQIQDEKGNVIPFQLMGKKKQNYEIIQNPNDTANVMPSCQYQVKIKADGIPAMGYKTYKVTPLYDTRPSNPVTMLTSAQTMENEYISVTVNSNGTLDVVEKATGRAYNQIGYFKDTGEIGNPWEHILPEKNLTFTTLNEKATVTLMHDGAMECSFKVEIDWSLPVSRAADEKSRSTYMTPYKIENIITLRKGQRYVEITTNLNNTAEDHYLQVAFPTNIKATHVAAQGQFDVVMRPIEKYDYTQYDEIPMTEYPMNSFVGISDGKEGIALLNEGLKAYEADDDARNTMYLSLLRCFPLRICVTAEMQDYSDKDKGSQCLGPQSFRYAFMPHQGDWEEGDVWRESEKFTLELRAAQLTPNKDGKNPLEKSFIEFKDENLHISAIKQSEDKSGWVVRLFNPSDKAVKNAIRINGGLTAGQEQSMVERQAANFKLPSYSDKPWTSAEVVSLEELPQDKLTIGSDGWTEFEITGKKILTLMFK